MHRLRNAPKTPLAVAGILATPLFFGALMAFSLVLDKPSVEVTKRGAEILADPLGLRLVSFESATDSFTAQGSGGWFVGDEGADTTRFAVGISPILQRRLVQSCALVAQALPAQPASGSAG